MLKKTLLATLTGAAVLASGASFADPYYRHGHREVAVRHYHYPAPRPIVVERYYHPRPVVVQRQVVVQRPAPVYYQSVDPGAGLAILAGAVIGGAIAYNIANGH